jgi:hypothetical protein
MFNRLHPDPVLSGYRDTGIRSADVTHGMTVIGAVLRIPAHTGSVPDIVTAILLMATGTAIMATSSTGTIGTETTTVETETAGMTTTTGID